MDIRKIKKLIELVEDSGIAELEISEGEGSVRIAKQSTTVLAQPPVAAVAPTSEPTMVASPTPGAPAPTQDEGHVITAPMIGTFYAAPNPDSAPFVQVGDRVEAGDVLCIIEAMKMMNQIEADSAGIVKSIRCQNGEPVEFDQALFVIDAA